MSFPSYHIVKTLLPFAAIIPLVACSPEKPGNIPGEADDSQPFNEITESETVYFTGTEPFWSGDVAGGTMRFKTPDVPEGAAIAVERFAGRGGLSYSAAIPAAFSGIGAVGDEFTMMITPGICSDGMSDRRYPYSITLLWGKEQRLGCAWTDKRGFTGGDDGEK